MVDGYKLDEPDALGIVERLRVYGRLYDQVIITISKANALLMADDLERGIAARLANKESQMDNKHTIHPGDEVRDLVTGLQGIAVSVTEFLNGCRRVCVSPPVGEDGAFRDERWLDEPQLEIVQRAKVRPNPALPMPEPEVLRADPSRRPGGGTDTPHR